MGQILIKWLSADELIIEKMGQLITGRLKGTSPIVKRGRWLETDEAAVTTTKNVEVKIQPKTIYAHNM